MILTLTVNPAVDQTLWVDRLTPGEIHRPREVHLDPAGKGINVSRMAKRLGAPTLALGFLAGDIGRIVRKSLDGERVHHHFLDIEGQTRINVTVMDDAGAATSFYAPGPAVTKQEYARLDELLDVWLDATRVLVLAGSLLPGIAPSAYADLVTRANKRGCKTILDADGAHFRLGLAAKPWMIKPNVEEAERLLGRKLDSFEEILKAGRELVAGGIATVIISMGGDGALCVTPERAIRIRPPKVKRLSTVGSGDSMVAGIAVALTRGDDLTVGLRLGTAAGAATAMSSGTALGTVEDIVRLQPQVKLEEVTAV